MVLRFWSPISSSSLPSLIPVHPFWKWLARTAYGNHDVCALFISAPTFLTLFLLKMYSTIQMLIILPCLNNVYFSGCWKLIFWDKWVVCPPVPIHTLRLFTEAGPGRRSCKFVVLVHTPWTLDSYDKSLRRWSDGSDSTCYKASWPQKHHQKSVEQFALQP